MTLLCMRLGLESWSVTWRNLWAGQPFSKTD